MKTVKALLVILSLFIVTSAFAQNNDIRNSDDIASYVNSGSFVFKAQSVTPETGNVRQLTTPFTLSVSKYDIVSNLPYFGKAYSAPVDPTQGNLQFTSKNFQYITIKPKDVQSDGLEMYFTIYEDGTASLDISSETRQAISFNGYIEAAK
jgi:hypothetical protein